MQIRLPDSIELVGENGKMLSASCVELAFNGKMVVPRVTADETPLCFLILKWRLGDGEHPENPVRVLGDAWERGYGDLAWRGIEPHRSMPWYFLTYDEKTGKTEGFGVKVRPAAMCFWRYAGAELVLYADIRSGGRGVVLGGRTLDVCEVVFFETVGKSAYAAGRDFCSLMCTDGIFPKTAVYGFNNWYYAYGVSSEEEILDDTDRLMKYCKNVSCKPYMVIDDGWQTNFNDGPWESGNEKFPDMKRLACAISEKGAIPGIWYRPLRQEAKTDVPIPEEWRLERDGNFLDPSHPEVLDYVEKCVRRLSDWGYKLIKHDFSTNDIFGKWGFECPNTMTDGGVWGFYDNGRTTAEIILELYTRILRGAGDAVIIGCNTVSHLCAGLAHVSRTGDDTSGREWSRTCKMGVNTLAFRLMQNGIFYAADADCVGITPDVPWHLNKKWLSVLACSASPLFVSWNAVCDDADICESVAAAFERNSRGDDVLEPADWFETAIPEKWLLNGEAISFDWYENTPVDISAAI